MEIVRKQMKTCRLKVFPDQAIKLSTPKSAPVEWIKDFLEEKSGWIEAKLNNFTKTKGYAATAEIRNGMSIKLLGEDLIFSVTHSEKALFTKKAKSYMFVATTLTIKIIYWHCLKYGGEKKH